MSSRARPRGVTIICILWFFSSLFNLITSSVSIRDFLEIFPFLDMYPTWFEFAVPLEGIYSIIGFGIGVVQIFTVYGLWVGESWSYKTSQISIISVLILSVLINMLYSTYPQELIEEWGNMDLDIFGLVSRFFTTFIYVGYIRQIHVKKYLMNKALQNTNQTAEEKE